MAIVAAAVPFAFIHNLFVARVAAALGLSTDFVRPVASDNYQVTEMENLFAYIRTYGPSPVNPTTGEHFPNDGAGRYRRVVGRRVRVYLYTRSGVDAVGGDEIALSGEDDEQTVETPPTMPGQFALEDVLLSALDHWMVTYVDEDNNTKGATLGPVEWIDSADGPPEREPEDDVGLVRSHLDFLVVYTQALKLGEPAPAITATPNPGN